MVTVLLLYVFQIQMLTNSHRIANYFVFIRCLIQFNLYNFFQVLMSLKHFKLGS